MKLTDTILTIGKVALKSRPVVNGRKRHSHEGTLVIMGNGPSLRKTIDEEIGILEKNDTMAVNFAANTEEFFKIRPCHYVLADPHFFKASDANVAALWENLGKVNWEMTLHIPVRQKPLPLPQNVGIKRYNLTPAEGYDWVCHRLYTAGLAMPRPRNVLIPAIMEGIREGYEEIFLVGADHTWPHTLYVDENNRVVTVQPHFYKESPKELDRIAETYAGVRLHEVLQSMTIAFRSYHAIKEYADRRGVRIYNSTPGSLIDAFPRKKPR